MSCEAMREVLDESARRRVALDAELRAHLASCPGCAGHQRFLLALAAALAEEAPPPPDPEILARTRLRAARALRAHAATPSRGLVRELALAVSVLALALPFTVAHAWLVAEGAAALLGGLLPPLLLEGLGVVYFGSLALAVGALYALVPIWVATIRRARTEAA